MASGNTFFEVYMHIWNGESVIKTASPFACILTEDGQKITQFTPASSGETTNVIYDGQYHIVFRFNVNLPKGRHRLMFKMNSTYYHEIELICEDNRVLLFLYSHLRLCK